MYHFERIYFLIMITFTTFIAVHLYHIYMQHIPISKYAHKIYNFCLLYSNIFTF